MGAIPVAVLCLLGITSPAKATPLYSWMQSVAAPTWCAQENGTTSGVYLDPCSTNSSDEWFSPDTDGLLIENRHSQLCMTAEENGVVDLKTCSPGDEYQEWSTPYDTAPGGWIYYNLGYGSYLWQSTKTIQWRTGYDINSSHDSWVLNTPS